MRKLSTFTVVLLLAFLSSCNEEERGAVVPPVVTGTISGVVWLDADGDGIRDEEEQGLENVEVTLIHADSDATWTATTDAAGATTFANVEAGEYSLKYSLPHDFIFSPQHQGGDNTRDSDPDPSTGETDRFQIEFAGETEQHDAGLTGVPGTAHSDDGTGSAGDPDTFSLDVSTATNPFEVDVIEDEAATCDNRYPGGGGKSVLQGSEDGFVLQLYNPLGLGIRGDGEGGLEAVYNGPKSAGVGEAKPRQVEVIDLLRDGDTVTILLKETHFADDGPEEGCTRTYTLVYRFGNSQILDFLSRAPTNGKGDVKVENPDLEFGDAFFTLTGQFVNLEPGQVYHVWTEISGTELSYDLTQIFPDPDGKYVTIVEVILPDGTHVTINVLANGVKVIGTSGSAPSSE